MHQKILARAAGRPQVYGMIRVVPEDFGVEEMLGFELLDQGEHHWLQVRKRGWNTEKVAQKLASFAGVRVREVGYSGLKDRNALTTQWFSIRLPGKDSPDWGRFQVPGIELLAKTQHNKKLKRGVHRSNRFHIVVRHLEGELDTLPPVLERIVADGVPNYFGPQRFGIDGRNLDHARELFAAGHKWRGSRHRRGLYLSAARAWLFNGALSTRVAAATWNRALPGDVFQLDGSRSIFFPEGVDATIHQRIIDFDIHPTGPLWGRGELPSRGEVRMLEQKVADSMDLFRGGLEEVGLRQERRALRLPVKSLRWEVSDAASVTMEFELPRGAYATSVLRECINTEGGL